MARSARRGMFRTSDRIDAAKARHDAVALADARTSMSDYRLALCAALGRTDCDRNGFVRMLLQFPGENYFCELDAGHDGWHRSETLPGAVLTWRPESEPISFGGES